jgi:hypothetical protein
MRDRTKDICMKTVIFDFDGTIANTLPIGFYAFENVFITSTGWRIL